MGLSSSEQDLERVATGMIEELELRNNRPLDPDRLAVFVDGKYVEWRDGDKLRSACIYLAMGLGRDGKKRVLSCIARPGRENLEDWKTLLRGLMERGLRRVMIFIQDDFSGLLPISQSFFPHADVQLCAVPMQRHAKTHLSKTDSIEFQQRWRALQSSHSHPSIPTLQSPLQPRSAATLIPLLPQPPSPSAYSTSSKPHSSPPAASFKRRYPK